MKEVTQETNRPAQNIPYRNVNGPFRFQFVIPGEGITIQQDANGIKFISAEGGLSVADIVAGDNIYIEEKNGKLVISAVNSVTNIAAGQNVTITYDENTNNFIISAIIGSSSDEHYQGVFDTVDDLIAYDTNPDTGDYGMIKDIVVSDGETSWNGRYKYCFYINGAWTVVDQMLTFTTDTDLLQQFYSVGGSSPVIYLHEIARTGSFWTLTDAPIVATPVVDVRSNLVTVTCETEGADIWYTTDGTMPHVNGTRYTGPITVIGTQTFRFVGVKNGMINSLEAVADAGYSLDAPTVSLNWTDGTISMSNPNQSGDIYYTTDGTTPTSASTLYTGPFVITAATAFNLIVIDGGTESAVTTKSYSKVAVPASNESALNYITGFYTRVYQCGTSDAIMKYTTDGTTPDYSSNTFEGTVQTSYYEIITVKCKAFAVDMVPSDVLTHVLGYAKPTAPSITYNPETQQVTIANVGNAESISPFYYEITSNLRCKMFYTLDGTTPTASSTLYTGPFTVNSNVTVKAVLIAYGQYSSDVSTLSLSMLEAPVITLDSDTGTITITNPNSTGSIYYTTNQSTPTSASTLYSAPFVLNTTTMVKAVVIDGANESTVASFLAAQYDAPTIAQTINYLIGKRTIGMNGYGGSTNIHYTMDGTTPTYQSTLYSGMFDLPLFGTAVTIKAIKIISGYLPTPVATLAIAASTPDAPTITYDSDASTVSLALSGNTTEIALQTNTNVPSVGARIWYTTDGSTPTAQNGTLWTGTPFAVEAGQTIKAVTICYSTDSSSVATENIPGGADYLYFEAAQANSTVSMLSTLTTAPSLEYSEDGTTWQTWTYTTNNGTHTFDTLTLTNINDKVYLRGTNGALNAGDGIQMSFFTMSGQINAGGNIMSLLDNTGTGTSVPDYGFSQLFFDPINSSNTSLLTPPSLGNVTAIGVGALHAMFMNCTALTTAMDMDNITSIAQEGCGNIYDGCTSMATPADMGNVSSFGNDSIESMYANTGSPLYLADFDDQYNATALKFNFPELPVNIGTSKTLSTLTEVVMYMFTGQ